MKIKELKEILKNLPEEMDEVEIYSTMSSGCCGDVEQLEDLDIDFRLPDLKGKDKGSLRFYYSALPGYRSCIQSGATLRGDKEYWLKFPASQWYKLYSKEGSNE